MSHNATAAAVVLTTKPKAAGLREGCAEAKKQKCCRFTLRPNEDEQGNRALIPQGFALSSNTSIRSLSLVKRQMTSHRQSMFIEQKFGQ